MRGLPAPAWCVLALQAIKLLLCWQLPLFGDEAFYWLESRHPAPAYDDVPGLLPWLIALSTGLLGEGALAIRLPALLLSWATLILLFRAVAALADPLTAWRGLLLASLPPIMGMNGVMALPDAGINLAVVLCLLGAQRELSGRSAGSAWLALGVLVGVLAHYRFALPLMAALLALACAPSLRPLLATRVVVPVVLAALLGLAPLVWHAVIQGGRGLAFQFAERHPFRFQPELLGDPLLQAVAVGPPLYLLLLWAGWRARRGVPALAVWGLWGLCLVALYWLLGPWVDSARSRVHWPAPAYLALAVPLALAWPSLAPGWRRTGWAFGGLSCALGTGYLLWVALLPGSLVGSPLYPHNFLGAPRLASALESRLQSLPREAPLAVDHFLLAAQLEQRLAERGEARPVYVLDHPQNAKHGRQRELGRMGRDALAFEAARDVQGLLVVEPAALPMRQRAEWMWQLCQRYPTLEWLDELWLDRGGKRYVLYRMPAAGTPAKGCATPAIGYIDLRDGARLHPGQRIGGWATAGGAGIVGLRLDIEGGERLRLDWPLPLPDLATLIGETGDPEFPQVGWQATLPATLAPGRHRLLLQAEVSGRGWHPVAAVTVRVAAR